MATKVTLDRPDKDYDHWLEITQISEDQFKVQKKDSKPVFNEDKYTYSRNSEGDLQCQSGTHSCSGAGKSRSVTPSDKLNKEIKEVIKSITG